MANAGSMKPYLLILNSFQLKCLYFSPLGSDTGNNFLSHIPFSLELAVPSARTFVIASMAVLAAGGCATNESVRQAPQPTLPATILSGTSGNMERYLGTWTSMCGREYRITPSGSGGLTSGINSFEFKSVAGNTVQGTLIVDTYETPDCTGPSKRATVNISLAYTQNLPVIGSYAEPARFSGFADKVTATVASTDGTGNSNIFNVGFLENFTKFQLAPLDYFSSSNLVYTKK